jgi:hypothetical protein
VFLWSRHPEARLVHGWVADSFNRGERIQHAWCEAEAIGTFEDGSEAPIFVVHDLSQLDERFRTCPRDLYYARCSVDPQSLRRFTREEAIRMTSRYGHDGPWEESPP